MENFTDKLVHWISYSARFANHLLAYQSSWKVADGSGVVKMTYNKDDPGGEAVMLFVERQNGNS